MWTAILSSHVAISEIADQDVGSECANFHATLLRQISVALLLDHRLDITRVDRISMESIDLVFDQDFPVCPNAILVGAGKDPH